VLQHILSRQAAPGTTPLETGPKFGNKSKLRRRVLELLLGLLMSMTAEERALSCRTLVSQGWPKVVLSILREHPPVFKRRGKARVHTEKDQEKPHEVAAVQPGGAGGARHCHSLEVPEEAATSALRAGGARRSLEVTH
jgi:hypothetical protein